MSEEWKTLRTFRESLLTGEMVGKYLSEVSGPKGVKLLKQQKVPSALNKKFYILLRLLHSAQLVLSNKYFVYFPDGHPFREQVFLA